MSGWRVEFLNETVETEFDAFPADIKAKIAHISKLIEEVCLQNVGGPYVKHVQGKIWEIRASQGRCLYVTVQVKKAIILRSFMKKSQKIPKKELEIAKIRAQEVQNG